MFEIDEHLINQIGTIVLIVFFIVLFFGYIITAIFSKIMFDILGVRPGLAFIPFYNTYRIYKEYKGRVWKKNWGVAYIITFAIPMAVIGGFVFALINLPIITGDRFHEELVTTLILGFAVLVIGGIVISVFNFILLFITYLPIFDTKGRRIVLYIQAGLTILSKLSVDGEIWTTRLYGQSIETIMNTLEEIPEIEGIVVTVEGKVYYSKGILDRIIE